MKQLQTHLDKYYTKPDVANVCISFIKKYIQINLDDLIIEPSAGNGSFIDGIKSLVNNFIFYDIEPEHDSIHKQDYLSCDFSILRNAFKQIHIVGNPPFGRQNSMTIKFIKKSCGFCDSVSFILPKSFRKDSLKKHFPSNFHLVYEYHLTDNSFLVNNIEYNVPCIFQIWKKQDFDRIPIKQLIPLNFIFVKKTENPDISVRRVGSNAGLISIDIIDKNIQSHYFIKIRDEYKSKIPQLGSITYEFNNTVGPKSISKQELIQKFNDVLK
jgi:predicted RNA methylase